MNEHAEIVIGQGSEIIFANSAAMALLGRTPEAVLHEFSNSTMNADNCSRENSGVGAIGATDESGRVIITFRCRRTDPKWEEVVVRARAIKNCYGTELAFDYLALHSVSAATAERLLNQLSRKDD